MLVNLIAPVFAIPVSYTHLNGSSCQCLGNPMAFVSTSGYCDNKSLNLAHNSFRGSMGLMYWPIYAKTGAPEQQTPD